MTGGASSHEDTRMRTSGRTIHSLGGREGRDGEGVRGREGNTERAKERKKQGIGIQERKEVMKRGWLYLDDGSGGDLACTVRVGADARVVVQQPRQIQTYTQKGREKKVGRETRF